MSRVRVSSDPTAATGVGRGRSATGFRLTTTTSGPFGGCPRLERGSPRAAVTQVPPRTGSQGAETAILPVRRAPDPTRPSPRNECGNTCRTLHGSDEIGGRVD